jgi:NADPH:quinone reductase-like Zn-dependent oxidoreductase
MKAVLIHQHGDPEVLTLEDFPMPEPGPGQVLVRLEAAALNRLDLWVRTGWPGIKLKYPHILGADGAGRLADIGASVVQWGLGDRVVINSNIGCGHCGFCIAGQDNMCSEWELLGETIHGTYAEYVVVPANNIVAVPAGFSLHEAAAAALVFHTAWHSLIKRAHLRPGETVLIVGASGGVNTACIQVAKLAGATVYVIGSSTEKLELAESLGADHLIHRLEHENWSKVIYKMTNRTGVDVVVDNVGTTFPLSMRAARKGGRILTVGNTGSPKFEIDNRFIFGKHLSILGSTMGTQNDFRQVMNMIFQGRLKSVVDKTFPLSEAAEAHKRLESGKQMGKITLDIQTGRAE